MFAQVRAESGSVGVPIAGGCEFLSPEMATAHCRPVICGVALLKV
jgi:hypothetical protein